MPTAEPIDPVAARHALWRAGRVGWALDDNQRRIYDQIKQSKARKFILDIARRVGKTTIMLALAIEIALAREKIRVAYVAGTQDAIKDYALPVIDWFFSLDVPPELKPTYRERDGRLIFPSTGSHIALIGLEQHPDRARGPATDLICVDEAGFIPRLQYVLRNVMTPQMQGRPWCRMLVGSTPPVSTTHYFSELVVEAKPKGRDFYAHSTMYDNPRLTPEELKFFCEEAGGPDSIDHMRENLAMHISDPTLQIVPEFTAARTPEELKTGLPPSAIVYEVERPPYFDGYVAMDPGFSDLTAGVFAYWHFALAKIVIEYDMALARANTEMIATEIKRVETLAWAGCKREKGKPQPLLRVSDIDHRLIADLAKDHKLYFSPTQKDDPLAALNQARLMFSRRQIVIHPRCTTLIAHLEAGVWRDGSRKQNLTDFARSGECGHFDCLAALVYLVRNVNRNRNPYPLYTHGEASPSHWMPPVEMKSGIAKAFLPRRPSRGRTA